MYYEINIAKDGHHFFATAERSITNMVQAKEMYILFKEKFPESEGYEISVTRWDKVGKSIDMEMEEA